MVTDKNVSAETFPLKRFRGNVGKATIDPFDCHRYDCYEQRKADYSQTNIILIRASDHHNNLSDTVP